MSVPKSDPTPDTQVDLVLANTVSRLGCSISEAREHLARQAKENAVPSTAKAPSKPISKSDESLL